MNNNTVYPDAHEKNKKRNIIIGTAIAVVLCVGGIAVATKIGTDDNSSTPSTFSDSPSSEDTITKEALASDENTSDEELSSSEDSTSSKESTAAETEEVNKTTEPTVSVEEYEAAIHDVQPNVQFAHFTSKATLESTGDDLLDEANRLAASYDYDAAINLLSSSDGYAENKEYADAVKEYEDAKGKVTRWNTNNNITHIFFHTLIADPSLAFGEAAGKKSSDYNQVMTTIDEFVKMMEEMYEKDYVLVSLHQIAQMETQEDGTQKMTYQDIYLPEGKTPFVLSVDDVSYYEYMTGHGFATRLIVKEDGSVVNEMDLTDGSTVEGAFDVLPILEEFVKLHPDFSYQGARGILALTGYNGVFGYRTSDYTYNETCDYRTDSIENPNPNIEEDKATATEVAQAIRNLGWELASHSWGHRRYGQIEMDKLTWDADMWEKEVEPILGETDIILFAYGDDIGSWRGYSDDNERYQLLKSLGFDYFCNVDSNQYYLQRTDNYLRQGRRNLDGERMWEAIEADQGVEGYTNRLSDLFDDVSSIFDSSRPTPVE